MPTGLALRFSIAQMTPQRSPDLPANLDAASRLQARNSAAFWAATGRARGHEVIHRRGFLAVAGKPLYESIGFHAAAPATWWSSQ